MNIFWEGSEQKQRSIRGGPVELVKPAAPDNQLLWKKNPRLVPLG